MNKAKKRVRTSNPQYPKLEEQLLEEIKQKRVKEKAIGVQWIQYRAKAIINTTTTITSTSTPPPTNMYAEFKASRKWVTRFLKRSNLTLRVVTNIKKEGM